MILIVLLVCWIFHLHINIVFIYSILIFFAVMRSYFNYFYWRKCHAAFYQYFMLIGMTSLKIIVNHRISTYYLSQVDYNGQGRNNLLFILSRVTSWESLKPQIRGELRRLRNCLKRFAPVAWKPSWIMHILMTKFKKFQDIGRRKWLQLGVLFLS